MAALALPASAESSAGGSSASARVNITVVVPPVFQVLDSQALPNGYQLRVYTNMPSMVLYGQEVRFPVRGEQSVFVPIASGPGYAIGSDGVITYTQP